MAESRDCQSPEKQEDNDQEGPFRLAPGETFKTCPYDPSHRVTNNRELGHLNKCRRNYEKEMKSKGQEINIGICRFNYCHQIPLKELESHEETCEDQYPSVEHISSMTSTKGQESKVDIIKRNAAFRKQQLKAQKKGDGEGGEGEEEDWEEDLAQKKGTVNTYDPRAKLEKNPGFFQPRGLTPSEKKLFREAQRPKFLEKLKTQDVSNKTGTVFVTREMMEKMELDRKMGIHSEIESSNTTAASDVVRVPSFPSWTLKRRRPPFQSPRQSSSSALDSDLTSSDSTASSEAETSSKTAGKATDGIDTAASSSSFFTTDTEESDKDTTGSVSPYNSSDFSF